MTLNQKLRALMRKHNLTRRAVCVLLGFRVYRSGSNSRLDAWLLADDNPGQNPMPPQMLELLELKLNVPRGEAKKP